jgi:L-threonylcarbamoyladenylate synthase
VANKKKPDSLPLTDMELRIHAAVLVLKAGGIVAYPTDTLYGLGADAFNMEAVERVFAAKGRDRDHGLPVLIADIGQLDQVAVEVSAAALQLARCFWPGALTLVLKRSPQLPAIVSGGAPTVAVRIPNHEVPLALVRQLGNPIIGTSANRTGASDPVTAMEVDEQIGPWLDYIIDVGETPRGEPSTIVDMTGQEPRILREGALPAEEVLDALKDLPAEDSSPRQRVR